MKKRTKLLINSIVIIVSIAIISLPLISIAQGNKISLLANISGELPIDIIKGQFASLSIMDDNEAIEKITPTPIVYSNPNGFEKKVDLIMKINKNSSINYNSLCVSINDNIFDLSKEVFDYDEYNYYFILGSKKISAYSNNQDMIRIWLKKENLDLKEEAEITFNFIAKG